MKVALVGDMHWGARGDSEILHEHFMRFADEVLIPELEARGVGLVLQLGDFFDRRKSINFLTLQRAMEFVIRLRSSQIRLAVLVGNHDIFYKNTLFPNSPEMLLEWEGVHVIDSPSDNFFGESMLVVPWICDESRESVMEAVQRSSSRFCFGHFEFSGFQMYRGVECEHGDDHRDFSKFEKVFSGHFHTPSTRDNVVYVGTPYDIVWSDYGDRKGFIVLDTETGETEFIENPRKLHVLIEWRNGLVTELPETKDRYVKVKVVEADDPKTLERFLKSLAESGPAHLAVVDTRLAEEELVDFEGVSEKDPITALRDEIRLTFEGAQQQSILEKTNELYQEALTSVEEM